MQDADQEQIFRDEMKRMKSYKNDFSMMLFVVALLYTVIMGVLDQKGFNIGWPEPFSVQTITTARHGLEIICLMAAVIFIVEVSRPHISRGTMLLQVPAILLYQIAIIVFPACLSILSPDPYWMLLGRSILLFISIVLAVAQSSRRRYQKDLQKALQIIAESKKIQVNSVQVVGKKPVPRCILCGDESQYEVCMECEKRFQGERQRVRGQVLRAKQSGVPATLTLSEWIETLITFHGRCAYCNGPYQVLEHYIPIIAGGGTTKENCVPSCISCNSKKSGKHPEQPLTWDDILPQPKVIKKTEK